MPDLLTCYQRIYTIVRCIPRGRVMTYGQLAGLVIDALANPVPAITVGRAMAASERYAADIPWWRVIGRNGDYGVLRSLPLSKIQHDLLAEEGIVADDEGRYDLRRYLYEPE